MIQSKADARTREAAEVLTRHLKASANKRQVHFLGPSKAPISRVKGKYRYQILVKTETRSDLNWVSRQTVHLVETLKTLKDIEVYLDVDPYQFS